MPRRYVSSERVEQTEATLKALKSPTLAVKQARHSPYSLRFDKHFEEIHGDFTAQVSWDDIIRSYFRAPYPSKRTIQRLYRAALEDKFGIPRAKGKTPKKRPAKTLPRNTAKKKTARR